MAVRNYDDINPKTVLQNIKRILESQDIGLLQQPAYRILITHCGFIAHYDLNGFKATYRDHLDDFVEFFLQAEKSVLLMACQDNQFTNGRFTWKTRAPTCTTPATGA